MMKSISSFIGQTARNNNLRSKFANIAALNRCNGTVVFANKNLNAKFFYSTESSDNTQATAEKSISEWEDKGELSIISWSVNGLRAVLKKGNLLQDLVEQEKPDILCLQETKLTDRTLQQVADQLNFLTDNYKPIFNHCVIRPGYAGTAVFTRVPPVSVTRGMGIPKHDHEGRIICVEFEKFYLINTEAPDSGDKLQRLEYRTKEWDIDLTNWLEGLSKKKEIIWCGDLKVAHREIDFRAPDKLPKQPGFQPEERQNLDNFLKKGFIDTFRYLHGDVPRAYTYWMYAFNSKSLDMGLRFDYFIVSPGLGNNVKSSEILRDVGEDDHCPVKLVLDTHNLFNTKE